jgi:hypothetical protein
MKFCCLKTLNRMQVCRRAREWLSVRVVVANRRLGRKDTEAVLGFLLLWRDTVTTAVFIKENIIGPSLQFRVLVHYHGGKHGAQADMVLEKELRGLHWISRHQEEWHWAWAFEWNLKAHPLWHSSSNKATPNSAAPYGPIAGIAIPTATLGTCTSGSVLAIG